MAIKIKRLCKIIVACIIGIIGAILEAIGNITKYVKHRKQRRSK